MVIAACKDDCYTNLTFKSKDFFRNMGSKEVYNLRYRDAFSFIGTFGNKGPVIEKRAKNSEV